MYNFVFIEKPIFEFRVEVEVARVKQTGMLQLARMINRTPLAVVLQLIADEMFQQHHGRCFYDFESDVAETRVDL